MNKPDWKNIKTSDQVQIVLYLISLILFPLYLLFRSRFIGVLGYGSSVIASVMMIEKAFKSKKKIG